MFSEAPLASTPSLPDFDRATLSGIFPEPVPAIGKAEPSLPRFDHQLLAEIFGEQPPALVDARRPPPRIDEDSSPPRLGNILDGEAAANSVAPSTANAENMRSQGSDSLLSRIRHLFSAKAETPSPAENDLASASSSRELHEVLPDPTDAEGPHPPCAALSICSSADTASALPAVEVELSRPTNSNPLLDPEGATSVSSFASSTGAKSAAIQPDQANLLLGDVSPTSTLGNEPSSRSQEPNHAAVEDIKEIPSSDPAGGSLDNSVPAATALQYSEDYPPSVLSGGRVDTALEFETVAALPQAQVAPMQLRRTESPSLSSSLRPVSLDPNFPFVVEKEPPPLAFIDQPDIAAPTAKAAAADLDCAVQMEARTAGRVAQHAGAAAANSEPRKGRAAMQEPKPKTLLAELELDTAIRLRWVMRDIRANRTANSVAREDDMATLLRLGLVEIHDKLPSLTALGILELN